MKYQILTGALAVMLAGALMMIFILLRRKKEGSEQTEMKLNALAGCYLSLHMIDIARDTFEPVRDYAVLTGLVQEYNGQANFQMKVIMKNLILEKDLKDVLDFVEFTTLMERMEGRERIYMDFEGRMAGWCRAQFIMLNRERDQVLFGVSQINEDKFRENKLRQRAETDHVTGLRNRENGEHAVELQVENRQPGMFCVFEIDDFKAVNDDLGYEEGDRILRNVADAADSAFSGPSIKYRRNGACFGVFVPDVRDRNEARFLIRKLTEALDAMQDMITISGGVALYRPEENISIKELYERVDACRSVSRKVDGTMVSYYE